jgi:methionyl-tRNA synthetase
MSLKKSFYLTTTIPYVNADPHIGFALEVVQADALARTWRLQGHEVFYNSGSDEHGQKIFEAAQKVGQNVEEYVDHYSNEVRKLQGALGLSTDHFIRTTDLHHMSAAQEMWRRCEAAGDIYKKSYSGLYCVGCEAYKTQKDLDENGQCSTHPNLTIQTLTEENYFFRFSKYQEKLLEYLSLPQGIIPDWRREEAVNFVREGLEDFSISREKERLSWGVPVPGDDSQVMYVWFDALTNYISTLGWPEDKEGKFKKFWEEGWVVQTAGKDQVRFQSLMWQAMLFSVGIKNTDQVFYHGFINSGGQRMSKSLGNVISPYELVEKYGTDATRYLLLRHVHPVEDSDVTWERLDEWYEAHLVNGLGNLVSRILKLSETYVSEVHLKERDSHGTTLKFMEDFEFNKAMDHIWSEIGALDLLIQEKKPWESKDVTVIGGLMNEVGHIANSLKPFMPETADKILEAVRANKKPDNLFPRLTTSSSL